MDQFYLANADLYRKLVDGVNPDAGPSHFSRWENASAKDAKANVEERCNPDMVISARVRPMLEDESTAGFPCAVHPRLKKTSPATTIDLHDLYHHPVRRPFLKSTKYEVDKLFDSATTTEQIYADSIVDLISFAENGGIGTVFAYGQTGSGKTFTISEIQKLVVSSLVESVTDGSIEALMTITDLAGLHAFDLLNSREPIKILEDEHGTTHLVGARECAIRTKEQALELIEEATSFRRTASTFKNEASSRSHSICRLRIKRIDASTPEGCLYLIDLAGSEAARDMSNHGTERLRETKDINVSLSVLKDCIRGKAEAEALKRRGEMARLKRLHVPVRSNRLTKVLKHVLDPDGGKACKTVVIACVNPSLADVGATRNTLRYAEMLRVPVSGSKRPL